MPADRSPAVSRGCRTFLAERYRAGSSQAAAIRESNAARLVASELTGEGRPVILVGSLLVPSDETVYSLFEAASRDDIVAVGERSDQPYDRISEGIAVPPNRVRTKESR